MEEGACTIQRSWRRYRACRIVRKRRADHREQCEKDWQAQLGVEACVIQRAQRCKTARCELATRRAHRHADVDAARRADREAAVLVLQRATRCMIARKRVEAERVRQRKELHAEAVSLEQQCADDAATSVQSLWRGHRDRERVAQIRTQLSPPLSQSDAAIRIQCMTRSTAARRRVRERLDERRCAWTDRYRVEAATRIQSHARKAPKRRSLQRLTAARRAELKRVVHEEGARSIQSAVRTRRARTRTKGLRQDRARAWEANRCCSALLNAVDEGRMECAEREAHRMADSLEVNAVLSEFRFLGGASLHLGLGMLTLSLADRPAADVLPGLSALLRSSALSSRHAERLASLTQAFARSRFSRLVVNKHLARGTPDVKSPIRRQMEETARADLRSVLSPGRGLELLVGRRPGSGCRREKAATIPMCSLLARTMEGEIRQLDFAAQQNLAGSPRGSAGPVRRLQRCGRGGLMRLRLRICQLREAAARVLQGRLPELVRGRGKQRVALQLRSERRGRRREAERDLLRGEAAQCIQLWWKTACAVRETQTKAAERSDVRNQEVVVMQKLERDMQNAAATTIQCRQRCCAARAQTAHLRCERERSIREQMEAEERMLEMARQHSAACIQVWYRGRVFMSVARQRRVELKAQRFLFETAVTIQAGARGMLTRRRLRAERRRDAAVATLRCAGRGWQGRQQLSQLRRERRRERAATLLQAWTRGMFGRKQARRREAAEHARVLRQRADMAACFIQRAERRRIARRELERRQSVVQESEYAATILTRVVRGHLARQREVADLRRLRAAGILEANMYVATLDLQRIFRGGLRRRALASRRVQEYKAALDIQRAERGRVGRRQARAKKNVATDELTAHRREAATPIIQGAWRQALAREEVRRRRYKREEARRTTRWQARMLGRIQSCARGARARLQLRLRHLHARRACMKMQRVWRGAIARAVTGPKLHARRCIRAARRIQRVWRRLRPFLEQKADERAMLRGFARMQRSELQRQEKGARRELALGCDESFAMIRDTFRRALAGIGAPETLYSRFIADIPSRRANRAAIRIQKIVRRCIGRRRAEQLRRQREVRILREKEEEKRRSKDSETASFQHELEKGKRREIRGAQHLDSEFSGFSTAPERHQEWNHLFEDMRIPLDGPLRMLLGEESSQRAGLELAFSVQSEVVAAPFRAPPPLSQGWRSKERQLPAPPSRLLPPLGLNSGARGEDAAIDTIALQLGSSIHNTRRANVDLAFGSPRPEPPQPRRLLASQPLQPLTFRSADSRGAVKAVATTRGSVEALRRLICLDDPAVTVADVSGLGLGNESVLPLLSGLRGNSHVRVLDLSRNPLRDESAEAVAQLLRMNSSITAVDMSGTEITDVGASHLAATLAGGGNTSVQRLNLEATLTSATQRTRIASALLLRSLPATVPVGAGGAGARLLKRRPQRRGGGGGGLCADVASRPTAEAIALDAAAVHFGGARLLKTI